MGARSIEPRPPSLYLRLLIPPGSSYIFVFCQPVACRESRD